MFTRPLQDLDLRYRTENKWEQTQMNCTKCGKSTVAFHRISGGRGKSICEMLYINAYYRNTSHEIRISRNERYSELQKEPYAAQMLPRTKHIKHHQASGISNSQCTDHLKILDIHACFRHHPSTIQNSLGSQGEKP